MPNKQAILINKLESFIKVIIMQILGSTRDYKTETTVIYCLATPEQYLTIVGKDFEEFNLQRRREKHKNYDRLKEDIKAGTVLPGITLAVKPEFLDNVIDSFNNNPDDLVNHLSAPGSANILDGLQRTYILNDLKTNDNFDFKEEQKLLLEFWLEKDIQNIIYRMIVLNSGQKAMSIQHQIDLLFISLKSIIESKLPQGIELYSERDNSRRTQPNKYPLSQLAVSYHCFITKNHEQDQNSLIAKFQDDGVLDSSKEILNQQFQQFLQYFSFFTEIDKVAWEKYKNQSIDINETETNGHSNSYKDWLANDSAMFAFFAVLGSLQSTSLEGRIEKALNALKEIVSEENDPFELDFYHEVIKPEISRKRANIGANTRKVIASMFKEFIRNEGEQPIKECWRNAIV